MPRYLIQRTVPAGILNTVTNETLQSIQATNSVYDVRWIHTYVNRDKTKTFCIYEGPCEEAVRLANARNNLSIDQLDEIPGDMRPMRSQPSQGAEVSGSNPRNIRPIGP
jgi:hypothetical protein